MSTQFNFTVSVNASISPAIFTIYNSDGEVTTSPVLVTEPGTIITYQLREDSNAYALLSPIITNDGARDLSYSISKDGQLLTIVDMDSVPQNICLKLVAAPKAAILVSQDPQVIDRPRD